jgi:hypothetical protein
LLVDGAARIKISACYPIHKFKLLRGVKTVEPHEEFHAAIQFEILFSRYRERQTTGKKPISA